MNKIHINSDDYHDFVFKDGKLIGEFEQMYQKSKEVPWHQEKDSENVNFRIALEIASTGAPYDRIIELGCGLGYFTQALSKFRSGEEQIIGCDISPTAIEKATQRFPDIKFQVMDIQYPAQVFFNPIQGKTLIALRGVFWYVFPEMSQVVANICGIAKPDDYLLISQNFPPLDSDFVGKEVIPNPESLVRYFEPHFKKVILNYFEDCVKTANDNWIIALFVKK